MMKKSKHIDIKRHQNTKKKKRQNMKKQRIYKTARKQQNGKKSLPISNLKRKWIKLSDQNTQNCRMD